MSMIRHPRGFGVGSRHVNVTTAAKTTTTAVTVTSANRKIVIVSCQISHFSGSHPWRSVHRQRLRLRTEKDIPFFLPVPSPRSDFILPVLLTGSRRGRLGLGTFDCLPPSLSIGIDWFHTCEYGPSCYLGWEEVLMVRVRYDRVEDGLEDRRGLLFRWGRWW